MPIKKRGENMVSKNKNGDSAKIEGKCISGKAIEIMKKYCMWTDGHNLHLPDIGIPLSDVDRTYITAHKTDMINYLLVSKTLFAAYHGNHEYAQGMYDAYGEIGLKLSWPPATEAYLQENRTFDDTVKKEIEAFVWPRFNLELVECTT